MVSSLALFGDYNGLPLQRIAGITPLFESIRIGRILLVNVLVRVRFLIDFWILPSKCHRHAFSAIDQAVSLNEMRFRTAPASAGNSCPCGKANGVNDQCVSLPMANGMSDNRRFERVQRWMRPPIHVYMPSTEHFRNDQDLGIRLNNIQGGGMPFM